MDEQKSPQVVCFDARGNGDGDTVNTVTGDHADRVTDYTPLAVTGGEVAAVQKEPVRYNPYSTVRRLLVVECERLMAFPDNWTRIPWKGKPAEECPDSPRYKACGNSMCVNVMRWIGMRIELVERKMNK